MEQIGWSLVDGQGSEIDHWGDTLGQSRGLPDMLRLPNGDYVYAPSPGGIQDWALVPRWAERGEGNPVWDGSKIVVAFPVSVDDVVRERDRRLALGFEYDFGDERARHWISTTEADMRGWREVDDLAQTYINLQQPNGHINIETNTGSTILTALEWQQIKLAAAQFRQPLWLKSFLLQATTPIPGNYTDDVHWT